ncbi:hypothetical protein QQX98_009438 [Neonectria punicea]|uniref:Uncharacterized protein n=1 Tax=Neonectria punicea TaxID=979145 RepID=A0ABR1GSN5_9HYPO
MVMIPYPNGGPSGQPQAQGGPAASAANNGNVPANAGQNGYAFPQLANMPHGGLGMFGHVMNNGFAGPQGQNHGFGAPQAMNNGFAAAQRQNAAMANLNANPGLVNFQNNLGFAQAGNGFQYNNPGPAQAGNELRNNFGNLAIAENQGGSPAGNVVFDNANYQFQNQAGAPVPANMNINAVVADAQAQAIAPFNFNDFGNVNLPADAQLEVDMLFDDVPQAGPVADANGPAQFIFENPENFASDTEDDDDDSESDEEQESDDDDDDMDAPGEVVDVPDGANPAPFINYPIDPLMRMFVDHTGVQRLEFSTSHDLVQLLLHGPDGVNKANLSPLYARLAACFPGLGLTTTNVPGGGDQVANPFSRAVVKELRARFLRAHPPGPDMDSRNNFLLQGRDWQFTYGEIKELGNMHEAHSTLRGRHRNLLRVLAMVFTHRDIDLVRLAVRHLHGGAQPGNARATWRAITDWMRDAGSSVVFHPEAVKRKYALLRRHGRV